MKKLLSIFFVSLLLSVNAKANLFNLKTYAKCDFKSQTGSLSVITIIDLQSHNKLNYFAFDNEFLYYDYNIVEKKFDTKILHFNKKEPIKKTVKFTSVNGVKKAQLQFDGTKGELKVIQKKNGSFQGSLNFMCEKIPKFKLPKSKF